MNQRKLDALRNLAERPGTEAEGKLAREMLDRISGSAVEETEILGLGYFKNQIRDLPFQEYWALLLGRILREQSHPIPTHWTCPCGHVHAVGNKCQNAAGHAFIQDRIRLRFKKGDRVYYNRMAYEFNDPAVVAGYVKPVEENGNYPWVWIRLKFDRLKNSRQVPIYSAAGWHLSHSPIPEAQARKLRNA